MTDFIRIRRYLNKISLIAVFLLYAYLLFKYWGDLKIMFVQGWLLLAVLTALSILAMMNQTLGFMRLLQPAGKLPFSRTFSMWALSSMLNYVVPFQTGVLVRGVYFSRYGIGPVQFMIALLLWSLISAFVGVLIIIASLASIYTDTIYPLLLMAIIAFFLWKAFRKSLVSILGFVIRALSRWISQLRKVEINEIGYPPTIAFSLTVLQYILTIMAYVFIFNQFEINLNFMELVLFGTVIVLITIIPVTPNNVGIYDALLGLVVVGQGGGYSQAVIVPLFVRTSHILSFVVVFILQFRTLKNFRELL
jgi:uncharacterized membrane protein YbhN (UPF0104 family)